MQARTTESLHTPRSSRGEKWAGRPKQLAFKSTRDLNNPPRD